MAKNTRRRISRRQYTPAIPTLNDEVRQFCAKRHLRLNTDLGQHFLIDQTVLDHIIEAAQIGPEEHVVEIGPGIGVLTRELAKHARKITAIEIDEHLIPLLHSFLSRTESKGSDPTIIQGNALNTKMPSEPYKIVANIPYHITSPLLRHVFLESERTPVSMTLLIQREVAEKICDDKDAGMLTILVALFGAPRIVTIVPAESFLPPPAVESAVLHIDCFGEPRADAKTIDRIFVLTKIGFGKKRKMLSNTLGTLPDGMELLAKAGIDPKRRPQTLSIDEWIFLAKQE